MHPFALNQTATALVTGGNNVTTPNDGKALNDRKIGVFPEFPPIYTTMAYGEEGGEFPPVITL